jgi:lipopolysaccharide assembly protein A
MTVITWILRLLMVVLFTAFAIKNADIVTVKTFLGYQWQAPLALVLLAFFVGGVAIGLLGLLRTVFRLKREISKLQRTHQHDVSVAASSVAPSSLVPPSM